MNHYYFNFTTLLISYLTHFIMRKYFVYLCCIVCLVPVSPNKKSFLEKYFVCFPYMYSQHSKFTYHILNTRSATSGELAVKNMTECQKENRRQFDKSWKIMT